MSAATRHPRHGPDVPDACSEGCVDGQKPRLALGGSAEDGAEHYGLTWPGKAEARRLVQVPACTTLVPDRAASREFDTTGNVLIEGDNLEVLRLIKRAFYGRIKLIYLDPPYNTGKEVTYPDDFRTGLQDYLRAAQGPGPRAPGGPRAPKPHGRYHARWLSMMYPRLLLARDLLAPDGLIVVSISDHEVHNLRHMMDEIYGPEHFVGTLVWRSRASEDTRSKTGLSTDHEYLVCYRRSRAGRLRGARKDLSKFANPDADPRGPWRSADMTGLATRARRPNLHYDLVDPATGAVYGCPPLGWRFERTTMERKIAEGRVLWPACPTGRPRHKLFLEELGSPFKNTSSVLLGIDTREGTREVNELLGTGVFSFPKPVELVRFLVEQATAPRGGDLVLDLFAGSGSTAEAVWRQNRADGGDRRFILVQIPEPTGRTDYPTISDITRARLAAAAASWAAEPQGRCDLPGQAPPDHGFRTFRLTASDLGATAPPAEGADWVYPRSS
jgi:adenine-specific DNA-methyltransferase